MSDGNVIATYSNLENHPRLIRARQVRTTPKITLDPKTGLPLVDGEKVQKRISRRQVEPIEEVDEDERRKFVSSYYCGSRFSFLLSAIHVTVTRPKNESKEDKKARKQAVKAERQARRADKKSNKEQFSSEIKQQAKLLSEKEKTKMRKL